MRRAFTLVEVLVTVSIIANARIVSSQEDCCIASHLDKSRTLSYYTRRYAYEQRALRQSVHAAASLPSSGP